MDYSLLAIEASPSSGTDLTPVLNAIAELSLVVDDVHDDVVGKWVVDEVNNTLIKYKKDGVTILKQFDLTTTTKKVPSYVSRIPV